MLASFGLFSCDETDEQPTLRAKLDYASLNPEIGYEEQFLDAAGASTVDLTEGHNLHNMFKALNYHATSSIANNITIDAAVLKNMFSNTGNPFYDISTSTISVIGDDLNASAMQLSSATASSLSATETTSVLATMENDFEDLAAASEHVNETAAQGQAGKLGTYLVDARGIEIVQVIQKSLIGALQLDYIGNVLLADGLSADNQKLVDGKNYSALEHNWDMAYALLTLNPIYLEGSTNDTRNTVEFGMGSYVWEYNKANYAKIYPAFLKGRAAIVNNDMAEIQKQATFIRTEFEKTMANSSLGYLNKWKTGATDAARAHAIAEGLGFIYSLRFAKLHGVEASFADELVNGLIGSTNGFWDLTNEKINTASDAIQNKFGL